MTLAVETPRSAATPFSLLRDALARHGDGLRVACSLGVEDMVVLHEAVRAGRDLDQKPRVFLLDTGRLPEASYELLDIARRHYAIDIEVYSPDALAVESLVRRQGANGFYESIEARHACCEARKLGPLTRALSGATAWVTGLRREQSPTRARVEVVETDERGLLKLSPLAEWTSERVWAFAREHHVPTHALHAQGYASIGCAPCTRSTNPGEPLRAGRWWWEAPEHKECGLHARRRS